MRKDKQLSVTIGIPAFNEAKNIARLVRQLLSQNQMNYVIHKIIIYSDGSTDQTNKIGKSLKNKHKEIVLMASKVRKGKPAAINRIFEKCKTDVVVILDADIVLASNRVIANLIKPFLRKEKANLVSGKAVPVKISNFLQYLILRGVEIWDYLRSKKTNNSMYFCEGSIRAFDKNLYRKLKFPDSSADDVYPYLYCFTHGLIFEYAKEAKVFYRLPSNYKDFFRQTIRFLNSQQIQERSFGRELIEKHFTISNREKTQAFAKFLWEKPVTTIFYLIIGLPPRISFLFANKETGALWKIASSTKE